MRPITLVLDTSAVAAYPSIDVAEPIAEVDSLDTDFGVPVAALAAALAETGDLNMIRHLMAQPGFVALDLTSAHWQQVGVTLGLVKGDVAAAHAVIVADEVDCEVLTGRPDLYLGLSDDDPPIIVLGEG